MRPLLIPAYMEDFSCIGSACEDTCCAGGWMLDIDKKTYQKYKKVNDVELKPLLEKNIARKRSNSSDQSYGKFKLDQNSACTFLTEEKWCGIQLKLGEDYLSNTCAVFPRIIRQVDDQVEKSGSLACPEIARLALLNPNQMEFNAIEELKNTPGFITASLNTNLSNSNQDNLLREYFWDFRIITIQILQNRSHKLLDRMILLGVFYQKIQDLIDESKFDNISSTIESYHSLMQEQSLTEQFAKLPTKYTFKVELCKKLLEATFIESSRYKECLNETLSGLALEAGSTDDEIKDKYLKAKESYYVPFISEKEYIFENYLVNYVFQNMFPYNEKTFFDSYVMLVVQYALIEVHLIGMAEFHKGLTEELVIKLVQSFTRTVDHNRPYLNSVIELLKENNITTMAHMAILIK